MHDHDESTEDTIRDLAQRVIWNLSRSTRQEPAKALEALRTIEWLSAIACDDWPSSEILNIYEELDQYVVWPFLDDSDAWNELCQLIAEAAHQTVKYGLQNWEPSPEPPISIEEFIDLGLGMDYLEPSPWPLRLLTMLTGANYWVVRDGLSDGSPEHE